MDASRLKSIPLFKDVPDEELGQIATFAQEVTVDAGRELVREGDFSYEFMAIEEGEAEVTRHGEHVANLGPGDFFGEMGLLDKAPRNADVVANGYTHLLMLHRRDLQRLFDRRPEVRAEIEAVAARRTAENPTD